MAKEPLSPKPADDAQGDPQAAPANPAAEAQLDSVLKDQVAREVQEAFADQAATGADNSSPNQAVPPAADGEADDAEIQRILTEEVGSLAEAAHATAAAKETSETPAGPAPQTAEPVAAEAAPTSPATAEIQKPSPAEPAPAATAEPPPTSPTESPVPAPAATAPADAAAASPPPAAVEAQAAAPTEAAARVTEDVKAAAKGSQNATASAAAAGALAEAVGDRAAKPDAKPTAKTAAKAAEAVQGDQRKALREGQAAPAEGEKPAPRKFSPRWLLAKLLWPLVKARPLLKAAVTLPPRGFFYLLNLIDRPFAFVDQEARELLGKVALLTLLAAAALFVFALLK